MFGINNKILASILIVSFYLLISANAIFPSGIFFSSGDTEQIINFKNFYYKKNGIWEFADAGRVNNNYASNFYYYFIFFIIDLLDLPDNYLSFFLKFTYLFFSFLSFFVSLKILKLNINFNSRILLSIAYSINFYTFYLFWYTWGYSTSHFYYIFVPVLFSSSIYFTYEDDAKKKIKFLINLIPLFFLSNIAFANLAWIMISLNIFLFVQLYKLITNFKILNYKLIIKEFIFFLSFVTLFLTFVAGNIFLQVLSVYDSNVIMSSDSLKSWIYSQVQNLPSAFFFLTHYQSIDTMFGLQFFSIFNFLILFYLLWKSKGPKKFVKLLLIFNIFIIFVTFKGLFLLPEFLLTKIFYSSLFYGFRSEDKSSLLLVYCILSLVAFLLVNLKKNQTIITLTIFLINLLSAYPLITGGIHYKHGINISKTSISDYKSLKNISNDLLKLQELTDLNKDIDIYNIIEAPHFVTTSIGWYHFPLSRHLGVSYYNQFSKMQIIGFNSVEQLLGEKTIPIWSSRDINTNWDINIISILSAKYILNHKNVSTTYYNNTNEKLKNLEYKKIVNKIYSGEEIDLYEVKEKYLNKKIYIPDQVIRGCIMDRNSDFKIIAKNLKPAIITAFETSQCNLEESFFKNQIDKIKKIDDNIIYKKPANSKFINIFYDEKLKQFTFEGVNLNKEIFIVFTQSFNNFWKLKCNNCKNNQEIKHIKINNSLNGWFINKNEQDRLEFTIHFKLEEYLKIYLFFLLTIFLSFIWIKKRFLY
jgi:hypothetical protein